MASTTDESMDSLQLAEIARQLHASQDLVDKPSTIQELPGLRDSLQGNNIPPLAQNDSIEDPDDSLPAVHHRTHVRVASGKKHTAATKLPLAKSSPILGHGPLGGIDDRDLRMTNSFAGFNVEDGDTQPYETTQLYKQYTSSAIGMSSVAQVGVSQGLGTKVDLTSDWDQPEEDDNVSIADVDMSELSPSTQHLVNSATKDNFVVPKTPALAGRKRNNCGEILDPTRTSDPKTSSTKTPGTEMSAGMFSAIKPGKVISLTQAFNQTQAPSSPLPNGPRSDPIFERPSPNFQPPRATSPLPRTSSPTKDFRSDLVRAVSEPPPDDYRTMKESQEEKQRRKLQGDERRRLDGSDDLLDDDDVLFNTETLVERQARRMRERARHSSDVLDRLSTPFTGRRSRPTSRSKETSRHHAPNFAAVHGSQDVQIPMTSSKPSILAATTTIIHSSPVRPLGSAAHEVPATASQHEKRSTGVLRATQATAIEDSQKERPESQKENDDPKVPDEDVNPMDTNSSQHVRFGGSQSTGVSTQARHALRARPQEMAGTSSIPPPPAITSQPAGDTYEPERELPSSPPLMTSDSRDEDGDVQDAQQLANHDPGAVTVFLPFAAEHEEQVRPRDTSRHACHEGSGKEDDTKLLNDTHDTRSLRFETLAAATTDTNATSTAYQTAHSHQTPSPLKKPATQNSATASRTPRSTRTRKLTDIAADPTPDPSYEQMDVDVNIMNDDDEDFTRIMSGSSPVRPARKKRITYSNKGQRAVAQPVQPKTSSSAKKQNNAVYGVDALPDTELGSPINRSAKKRDQRASFAVAKARAATAVDKIEKVDRKSAGKLTRPKRTTLLVKQAGRDSTPAIQSVEESEMVTTNDRSNVSEEQAHGNVAAQGHAVAAHGPFSAATNAEASRRPYQVIALCRDHHRYYWPARCLAKEFDGRLRVLFDEGVTDILEPRHVQAFDLRPGDVVKIDMPAMKKRDYIIQSVDATTVTVSAKPSGKGALAGKVTPATPVTVQIGRIYMTGMLWPQLKGRDYIHPSSAVSHAPQSTPVPEPAPSVLPTPASRSRRATTGVLKQEHQREASTSSFKQDSSLFQTMAFAVSFKDDSSVERKSTLRLLSEHSAEVLDTGFEGLFTTPAVTTSDSDSSRTNDALQLTEDTQKLGFVALITDTYSRRPKFLQALALGLPCLHHRWVRDCIAKKQVLPWDKYLLPAGESAWLGGAAKSRSLASYDPTQVKFTDAIQHRARLIDAEVAHGVLLVDAAVDALKAPKSTARAKKDAPPRGLDERRKRFVFMMFAAGAKQVQRVKNIDQAKSVLSVAKDNKWTWVYVDGDLQTAQTLLNAGGSEQGQTTAMSKRKYAGTEEAPVDVQGSVKVVNDELVIQSLILGSLAV